MIENEPLKTLLAEQSDWSTVAEFYSSNAVPTDEGFDPVNAIAKFAAVTGLTFRGVEYLPLVMNFGRISRTMTEAASTASVELSNLTRVIAQFEFSTGFEGLIMVIRLISRGRSTELSESMILFVGRCERPLKGDKESISVSAKDILSSLNVTVPRRTFGPEDFKGRVPSDPEFEGFLEMPQYGTVNFVRIEKRGGFLRLWNRKVVRGTVQWSAFSISDAEKPIPELFGRVQTMGVLIWAADIGTLIKMSWAFGEGPIQDIVGFRSTDSQLPLHPTLYAVLRGLVGTLNQGAVDPDWSPAWYSRLAFLKCAATNTAVDVTDPAPDVVAVVEGKIVTTPDNAGAWNTEAWTDNPAAVVRHFWTDENYFNLDPNWVNDTYSTECHNFNAEQIFNLSISDYTFVDVG